jgi:hypothetical protein
VGVDFLWLLLCGHAVTGGEAWAVRNQLASLQLTTFGISKGVMLYAVDGYRIRRLAFESLDAGLNTYLLSIASNRKGIPSHAIFKHLKK